MFLNFFYLLFKGKERGGWFEGLVYGLGELFLNLNIVNILIK